MSKPFIPSLKLLTIKPKVKDTEIEIKLNKINNIRHDIKYLSEEAYNRINASLVREVSYIKICPMYKIVNRNIMYVYSIKFEDNQDETIIDNTFYQSTGTSRGIEDKDNWYVGTNELGNKLVKGEEKHLDLIRSVYENESEYDGHDIFYQGVSIFSPESKYNFYSRFLTENNAYINKYMKKFTVDEINDIFDPVRLYTDGYQTAIQNIRDTQLCNNEHEYYIL
jgi:hypothetical protein